MGLLGLSAAADYDVSCALSSRGVVLPSADSTCHL